MRIIAGIAGRTAIKVPSGVSRPTTDFVRQALFSILSERVIESHVLDLFAGSGALGLEALSRGAASCRFVEENRHACMVIEENLKKSRLAGGQLVRGEVMQFLKRDVGLYDVVFADPPYWKHHGDVDHVAKLMESGLLENRIKSGGWLVAEVSTMQKAPESAGFQLLGRREYGSSAVLLYQRGESC